MAKVANSLPKTKMRTGSYPTDGANSDNVRITRAAEDALNQELSIQHAIESRELTQALGRHAAVNYHTGN